VRHRYNSSSRGENGVTTLCGAYLWSSHAHREAWCYRMRSYGTEGAEAADEWSPCEILSEANLTLDSSRVTCLQCLVLEHSDAHRTR
jgi:hypothetical protein